MQTSLMPAASLFDGSRSLLCLAKDNRGVQYLLVDGELVYRVRNRMAALFCTRKQWADIVRKLLLRGEYNGAY